MCTYAESFSFPYTCLHANPFVVTALTCANIEFNYRQILKVTYSLQISVNILKFITLTQIRAPFVPVFIVSLSFFSTWKKFVAIDDILSKCTYVYWVRILASMSRSDFINFTLERIKNLSFHTKWGGTRHILLYG